MLIICHYDYSNTGLRPSLLVFGSIISSSNSFSTAGAFDRWTHEWCIIRYLLDFVVVFSVSKGSSVSFDFRVIYSFLHVFFSIYYMYWRWEIIFFYVYVILIDYFILIYIFFKFQSFKLNWQNCNGFYYTYKESYFSYNLLTIFLNIFYLINFH